MRPVACLAKESLYGDATSIAGNIASTHMYEQPTAHLIDTASGGMSGSTGYYEKKIGELSDLYGDTEAFKELRKRRGEEIAYQVRDVKPQVAHGGLIFGTTLMQPGKVGAEFFMTRGHLHARADRPETYCGMSGVGVMLLETPEGDVKTMEIAPNVLIYVPPMWIHRSVNVGSDPLVMGFCYPADAGQNYQIIAESGGMAVRIVQGGSGWKSVPNENYQPRSVAQIRAILGAQA